MSCHGLIDPGNGCFAVQVPGMKMMIPRKREMAGIPRRVPSFQISPIANPGWVRFAPLPGAFLFHAVGMRGYRNKGLPDAVPRYLKCWRGFKRDQVRSSDSSVGRRSLGEGRPLCRPPRSLGEGRPPCRPPRSLGEGRPPCRPPRFLREGRPPCRPPSGPHLHGEDFATQNSEVPFLSMAAARRQSAPALQQATEAGRQGIRIQ